MKYSKLLTMACGALLVLASCEKVGTPSGDATVGFQAAELEYGLGSQYIYVPIVTTGETTVYPVKVTVAVKDYTGDYAAVEDVDYMITSKEIYVASAESAPSIEIKIVNPQDADELRFSLQITSQENAQELGISETLVKCAKTELDRVCGNYLFSGIVDDAAGSETWRLENDGEKVFIYNALGETGPITAEYDPETREIAFALGNANIIAAYNFSGIGTAYVGPLLGTSAGKYTSGTIYGQVNETYDAITFDIDDLAFYTGVFSIDDGSYLGWFTGPFKDSDNTITKIKKNQ